MEYRKFGNTYAVRMDRGEEVVAKLTELCELFSFQRSTLSDTLIGHDKINMCYNIPLYTYNVNGLISKTLTEPIRAP